MGCGASTLTEEELQARQTSREIDVQLLTERKELRDEVKLLLLGAGESGKSTFAKQMQIIHSNGFTKEERLTQRPVICCNVLDAMKKLVQAVERFKSDQRAPGPELLEDNEEAAEAIDEIDLTNDLQLTGQTVQYLKALWADTAVQAAYERRSEFQLNDSAAYFFDELSRLARTDYVPSEADILRLRKKTTGIIETRFVAGTLGFRMVDVGGQRNERKKWIHCFEDVKLVIFITSLSEYDCVLEEDETTNRMRESLCLFSDVINNRWFIKTPVILFMNKKDLFAEKIKRVNLNVCFKGYRGKQRDYDEAIGYIAKRFIDCNKSPSPDRQTIYTHQTCATDTDNARVVFNAVDEILVSGLIRYNGFG